MELWIRSQDKKRLSKIKDIYIADTDEDVAICGYSSDESDDFDLGIYHTIERALEVLDEIQAILKIKMQLQFDKKAACQGFPDNVEDIKVLLNKLSVYEMPKD